jgi:hypothetical protein
LARWSPLLSFLSTFISVSLPLTLPVDHPSPFRSVSHRLLFGDERRAAKLEGISASLCSRFWLCAFFLLGTACTSIAGCSSSALLLHGRLELRCKCLLFQNPLSWCDSLLKQHSQALEKAVARSSSQLAVMR